MNDQFTKNTRQPSQILLHSIWRLRVLFACSLLWLIPMLACGSFAPRPTPVPTLITQPSTQVLTEEQPAGGEEPFVILAATPVPSIVSTPLPGQAQNAPQQDIQEIPAQNAPEPTPTFTPTVAPGTALAVGNPARISAPNGLNLRSNATTSGQIIIRLGTGERVDVVQGPVTGEGYTWWELDDGQGNVGWAADGDGETVWISPNIGGAQPVNRPPQVGDRVVISTQQLTIRALPGTDGPLVTRLNQGEQLTVQGGPQAANGYTWYQVRTDDGRIEGWAADGDGNRRWMSPLE